MYKSFLILKSQMNQNLCYIPLVNTIDLMFHAYTIIACKLWLNVALCIEMNFLHTALIKSTLGTFIQPWTQYLNLNP
jgi:hypothetical protein